MKQTAVEFLIEQISSSKYFYNLMEELESRSTTVQPNILQQAKAMEQEQIIDAYKKQDMIKSICPKCACEPAIRLLGEYHCEMCGHKGW